ncbi:MAG: class II fructose-bisphosphate aldolase [bacterium]
MLAHIKDLVKQAEEEKYALGSFNIHNIESALAVSNAAMKLKSPAIIQVSESTIKYMGLKPVTHLVSTVAKNIATKVPIVLHLDHGRSLDSIFECIKAGFSSVHIDASQLPLDENISLTKQVVEMAHSKNVWVQGEIGSIKGGHGKIGDKIFDIPIAKPEDVIKFVKETKVDTIAAAIGTAHGVYSNEDIIFPLLKEIKAKTRLPFVLHGGSGVDDKKIKKAIKEGVNIINIGSDIKIAFCQAVIKNCSENKDETDPRVLLEPAIGAIEKVVEKKMRLFGSNGRINFREIKT